MDDPNSIVEHAPGLPNLDISTFGGRRFAFVKEALRTVFREQPTTVLAGHVNYGPLCLLLKLLRPRLKIGILIYGCEVWDKVSFLRRRSLKGADFIISISEFTKDRAVEANGINPDNIFVLPNALEWTDDFAAILQPCTTSNGLELLSVGRLDDAERRKGFDDVIKALPHVLSRFPNLRYKIVGAGTDLERHKLLAVKKGVADHVDFVGALSNRNLHQCYQACDVFVMPSAQEGFGFVYLEAMQYGKPVVAAKSGGAPEVVEDGVNGRLIEYGNTKQLAETLIELCADPVQRQTLGQAGHQRLQERFSFTQFQDNFRTILSRLGVMNGVEKI